MCYKHFCIYVCVHLNSYVISVYIHKLLYTCGCMCSGILFLHATIHYRSLSLTIKLYVSHSRFSIHAWTQTTTYGPLSYLSPQQPVKLNYKCNHCRPGFIFITNLHIEKRVFRDVNLYWWIAVLKCPVCTIEPVHPEAKVLWVLLCR